MFCGSDEDYELVNSIEDHTSSIISIKFGFDPEEKNAEKQLKLISAGADKTLIVRSIS